MDEAGRQLPLTLVLACFNNLLHESCDDWTYNYDTSSTHCSVSNSNKNLLFSELRDIVSYNNIWYNGFLVLALSSTALYTAVLWLLQQINDSKKGLKILIYKWMKDYSWL